ncbi:DNA repair protein RadC [Paraburkholderia sp. CNPSo 3076]|uniref:RadC family protein n=1 Tax=Paraburkholderia sp. CNPSo 3076 TaxID=2940936 RepID=UPI0022514D23|nr:DNA repair protein RadC [Paraburkholderia sp. CNPSo 3076]MCX5542306.1 DNA repair protein RadC [Paraburkholderia sp. CNPSo 3076]
MRELACMLDTAPDTVGGALADRLPGPGCAERRPRGGALPAPAAPAVSTRENAAPAAPRRDMPRERLRTAGAAALSDVELLAILLGFGLPGHNVFEVARTLLAQFGSLRAMFDAPHEEFEALRGIGPAKAAMLQAVTELARRALAQALDDKPLVDSPGAVEDYLRLLIGGRPHEVFVCLFLDVRHRLIRSEESSRGSLTHMAVYPREIVRRALTLNAASLIVAHNHPSGAVQPSASDRRLTRVLRETLALVEVQLIDHLVIGTRETFSFARHGWS